MTYSRFAPRIIHWQQHHGRHNLPWQTSNPYHVWLSEVMLQQTQVKSVLEYYARFISRFPDIGTLARSAQEEVIALWSGLGYYSRARNLHKAANQIIEQFNGQFPNQRQDIERLPGIGRSTAAAIASLAFNAREAILDGNVKRVLTRYFGISGYPGNKAIEERLWTLAEQLLPCLPQDMPTYAQSLMDLGALICRRSQPKCIDCPVHSDCIARQQNLTASLPTPRPKKTLPTKYTVMLLAVHGQCIWLERRPSSGIWGGLLSLPEFDAVWAAKHWIQRHATGDIQPAWPELEHTFTHYRLIITPLLVQLNIPLVHPSWHSYDLVCALDAGIPAPVRQLLLKLT